MGEKDRRGYAIPFKLLPRKKNAARRNIYIYMYILIRIYINIYVSLTLNEDEREGERVVCLVRERINRVRSGRKIYSSD